MSDNKNSFRDMILIIFVVLVCFGITIYGIAYLTEKVFSESTDVEVAGNDVPKEVSTNPQDGDTLTFTTMQEQGEEVKPNADIITSVTPPANKENENTEMAAADNVSPQVAEKEPVKQQAAAVAPKKEEVKKAEPKKAEPKKAEPKRTEVKKAEQPKKTENEPRKAVPKSNANYVVQIAAVQSRESAEKELVKYRAKFPDVFIKQVQIDGKIWYRIRLGVSATKAEADAKAKRVEQEFKIKPIVTKNN